MQKVKHQAINFLTALIVLVFAFSTVLFVPEEAKAVIVRYSSGHQVTVDNSSTGSSTIDNSSTNTSSSSESANIKSSNTIIMTINGHKYYINIGNTHIDGSNTSDQSQNGDTSSDNGDSNTSGQDQNGDNQSGNNDSNTSNQDQNENNEGSNNSSSSIDNTNNSNVIIKIHDPSEYPDYIPGNTPAPTPNPDDDITNPGNNIVDPDTDTGVDDDQDIDSSTPSVSTATVASGTKWATKLYIIESGKPGPVVMISGGVHGNETAGYKAARKIKDWSIKEGTLLVLPEANKNAISINRRYVSSDGDLNRDFPSTSSGSADSVLAREMLKILPKYDVDYLMDMHEGYDYYKNTSTDSVGQSCIYYPSSKMASISKKIVANLNKDISSSYKEFSLLKYPIKGSWARAAAVKYRVNSCIMETCSKESLSRRINNQLKAANTMLSELDMK